MPAVRAAAKLPMFLMAIPLVFLYGELPAKDFFDIVFVAPVRIDENAAYSRTLARENELEIIVIGTGCWKNPMPRIFPMLPPYSIKIRASAYPCWNTRARA